MFFLLETPINFHKIINDYTQLDFVPIKTQVSKICCFYKILFLQKQKNYSKNIIY